MPPLGVATTIEPLHTALLHFGLVTVAFSVSELACTIGTAMLRTQLLTSCAVKTYVPVVRPDAEVVLLRVVNTTVGIQVKVIGPEPMAETVAAPVFPPKQLID